MTKEMQVLLNLCAGACLADHMGDMADDIFRALEQVGIPLPDDVEDIDDLGQYLARQFGAMTVYGTSLLND